MLRPIVPSLHSTACAMAFATTCRVASETTSWLPPLRPTLPSRGVSACPPLSGRVESGGTGSSSGCSPVTSPPLGFEPATYARPSNPRRSLASKLRSLVVILLQLLLSNLLDRSDTGLFRDEHSVPP